MCARPDHVRPIRRHNYPLFCSLPCNPAPPGTCIDARDRTQKRISTRSRFTLKDGLYYTFHTNLCFRVEGVDHCTPDEMPCVRDPTASSQGCVGFELWDLVFRNLGWGSLIRCLMLNVQGLRFRVCGSRFWEPYQVRSYRAAVPAHPNAVA